MQDLHLLHEKLKQRFVQEIIDLQLQNDEITLEIAPINLRPVCLALRDEAHFKFAMLLDLCGVDYLNYGCSEWETEAATATGFDRGVQRVNQERVIAWGKPRFAVVYHLLSLEHNQRLRLKVFLSEEQLLVNSVIDIWPSADWYEREAFDLFGILFKGHPDLRRILTDYGFIGHPFRKDFPLIGNVEVRYDATEERVIYEPVNITPRVLVPKVIRRTESENPPFATDLPQEKANG